jgi:mRNA interferase MazF
MGWKVISRGGIYFVDLNPAKGREQRGRRPVLVVSVDSINRQPLVVTVVIGTDAANLSRSYSTNVHLKAGETGLPKDTVFLCFQIRSLDPSRFIDPRTGVPSPAGYAPETRMAEVDRALRRVLAL